MVNYQSIPAQALILMSPPAMTPTPARPVTRVPQGFLEQSLLGTRLGFNQQVIEDETFAGSTIVLRGREIANFGLCSYLGISDDPRLIEAGVDALRRYGSGYSSSLAYTSLPLYHDLRERLSAMLDASVLVAGTTTLAHLAALPVMVTDRDLVLIDGLAHASLQGVVPTLSAMGAKVERVRHNDIDRVAARAEETPGRVWYLIDGLYSMHGDLAPAADLRRALDDHDNLWVYCDDAHGFGWSGLRGRGWFLETHGWHDHLVMSFGLSKSFGALGGVVASRDPSILAAVAVTGGPMVFGGPIPPASLGAGVASADIHLSDELPSLQDELLEKIRFVNEYAEELGLELFDTDLTPLWYVQIGGTNTTASIVARVLKSGYFVNVAVYPVVQRGKSGLRFTVTRYNTIEQIRGLLDSINVARLLYEDGEDVIDLAAFE